MKKIKRSKCLESINSLYVDLGDNGYIAKPCCVFVQDSKTPQVETIQELLTNPYTKEIQKQFTKNWRRPECASCEMNENMGKESRRLRSLNWGYDGKIRRWDLRPGNTCNLKCAMCNFSNSSKWIEDLDIEEKYTGRKNKPKTFKREDIDWEWIYSQVVDTAHYIYIAGGEPFYMKNVHKFLEDLSTHEWNCKNTRIQIQTNGVSNTPKFLEILSKFKRLEFSISIDGWDKVNEIIRFPTNHNTWIENVNQLKQLDTEDLYFNITVQAMNLPDVDNLVYNIKDRWNGRYDIHKLYGPKQLSLNNLKPSVVEKVIETTSVPELHGFCKDYKYNEALNKKMQNYLLELDTRRGTDSKTVIPWCYA